MKIFAAKQIQYLDQFTIANEPIASIDLMERASLAFVDQFTKYFNTSKEIHIVCGAGNNAGDGLAIGRLLIERGYDVKIYLLKFTQNYTSDYIINLDRLQGISTAIFNIETITAIEQFPINGIIIDAIFGTGLTRPIEGFLKQIIEYLNQSNSPIISVDVPSGVFTDVVTSGVAIQANVVYSFQFPKLAFMMAENNLYINDFKVLDIGLLQSGIDRLETNYEFFTHEEASAIFKSRSKFSHKGSHGHLLLIVGSKGKAGAGILATKAALRSGVGLVTLYVPDEIIPIMQESVPEAMCLVKSKQDLLNDLKSSETFKTIGMGPGIGTESNISAFVTSLLSTYKRPMVIDADGINIISQHKSLLEVLPEGSILTPHPGEFRRLVGSWKNDFEKLALQIELSRKYKIVIVLKGAHTSISNSDGKISFNSTGNNGMATAGSGDTLTGIIAGLLTQGYESLHAAQLGVYLHGLAGDLSLESQHMNSLIASDIIDRLGSAFKTIEK